MNSQHVFHDRLSQLIASPSVSCTQTEYDMSNRAVIDLLANWLEPLGFNIEILPVPGHPTKANLVATLGKGEGGLVLAGHTDTVPCNPERWQQDPFVLTEKDDRYYGLGATDMKGFFPVVLAAIEKLKDQFQHLKEPLILLATADEESSMSGARALAHSKYPSARYAIIGEPTQMKPIRMHKGIMMEHIRVQGVAGHSSNPALGNNAMETMHEVMGELMRYRQALASRHTDAGFEISIPTLNLGCIHGGDNPNRICGSCELEFDLRPLPTMDIDSLHQEIDTLLKPIAKNRNTQIILSKLFPGVPAYEQHKDSLLVTTAEKLSGNKAQSVAFATEAPFLQQMGMETIVMGPGSIDQAHQPNEFLALDQIDPAIQAICDFIIAFCLKPLHIHK